MKVRKKSTKSTTQWLKRNFKDKYVKEAKQKGLRSRSWFKLDSIQQNDKIFRKGMTVIDLGSAPGGWSQYAINQVGKTGKVIAIDILPMNSIEGVKFFQVDFYNIKALNFLLKKNLNKNKVQIVMSDMAPNISGKSLIDISKTMHLVKLALEFSLTVLVKGGTFVVKMFHCEYFQKYLNEIKTLFTEVKVRKPDSSRACSKEVYIVATGCKNHD